MSMVLYISIYRRIYKYISNQGLQQCKGGMKKYLLKNNFTNIIFQKYKIQIQYEFNNS